VVLVPLQIVVTPLMEATGSAFTVTVELSVSVQPFVLVIVTVYVVVAEGETVIAELLPRLSDHAYTPAPEAVSVVLVPLQIVVSPLMEATGSAFTVTVTLSVSVQPFVLVIVTVYVVVAEGETVIAELLPRLFDHA
jgi:nicotinamide riboside transporter PnuC